MDTSYKAPTFDFGRAISQLFAQPGGGNYAIRLILWTSVFFGIAIVLVARPYLGMMGDLIENSWVSNQDPEDVEAALAILTGMTKYIWPMVLASLLMWAIYAAAETALHKRVFHDYDAGFVPLRFGMDELRVMAAQLLVYLMVFGVYFLGILLMIFIGAFAGFAGQASGVLAFILGLILLVGFFVFLWFLAFFSIRMAPAAALSTKFQKLTIGGGWAITKKRTGNLFLAYLLVFIVGYVAISVVQMTAFSMIFNESYFDLILGMSEENPRVIFEKIGEKLNQPGAKIMLGLGIIAYSVVSVIWWLTISGVANYAVQWWDETRDENALD